MTGNHPKLIYFKGRDCVLTNFYEFDFEYNVNGVKFNSVEHCYQYIKTKDELARVIQMAEQNVLHVRFSPKNRGKKKNMNLCTSYVALNSNSVSLFFLLINIKKINQRMFDKKKTMQVFVVQF